MTQFHKALCFYKKCVYVWVCACTCECRCLWSPAGGAGFGMFVSWWLVGNPRVFCKTHACSQPWIISPSPYRCVPLRWLLQSIAQMLVCFPVSQTGYYPSIYLTKSTGEWWSDNLLDHGNGDTSHQDMQILRYTNPSDWTLEMYAVYPVLWCSSRFQWLSQC